MDISERIKQRMSELGLRAVDIVRLAGVSKGTVSQWLNGIAKPDGKNIIALSKTLICEPSWLLSGEGEPGQNIKSTFDLSPTEVVDKYPLVTWVQAAMWDEDGFNKNDLDEITSYTCPVKCSKDTFVLRVHGVSMQPAFCQDDLIFVDPRAKKSDNRHVVAKLREGGQATFKQLVIEGDRKFLKPANPNWPEQLVEVDDSEIIGVVVFSGRIL